MGSDKRKLDQYGSGVVDLPRKTARAANASPDVPASQVNLIEADGKSCTHEVAWPPGAAESCSSLPPPRKPGLSARTYAFSLDPFQQTAVNCLEAGQCYNCHTDIFPTDMFFQKHNARICVRI